MIHHEDTRITKIARDQRTTDQHRNERIESGAFSTLACGFQQLGTCEALFGHCEATLKARQAAIRLFQWVIRGRLLSFPYSDFTTTTPG